jgi:metal-responsive CopG/Arc/MetJ family transcriptional regulator
MKAAISLPDPLFRRTDAAARRQRLSRSALIRRALEEYLAKPASDVTAEIDAALEDIGEDAENDRWVEATSKQALTRKT